MDSPELDLEKYFRDWCIGLGIKAEPSDFLKMPEAIAACLSICDYEEIPMPLEQRQRFADILSIQHGVQVTHRDPQSIRFFVPNATGQVRFYISGSHVYTREEIAAIPNLHITSPKNKLYLEGKSLTPAINRAWLNFPFLIIFMILSTIFSNGQLLLWLGLSLIALVIALLSIREIWQARRFFRSGQFLLGQLITCTGRWMPHSEKQRATRLYRVSYTYVVTMPDGKRRYGANHANYPYMDSPPPLGEVGQSIPLAYLHPNQVKNL